MSRFDLCEHMLITISNTIGSFKYDAKKMLTYVKPLTTWVKMSVNQYLLFTQVFRFRDTTSYFFRAGKVKTFKKVLSNKTKLKLIKELGKKGKLSDNRMKSAKEFIRSVDESSENYSTLRIYKNLKRRISMAIPPGPDSVELAINRHTYKHLHGYVVVSKTIKLLILKNLGGN